MFSIFLFPNKNGVRFILSIRKVLGKPRNKGTKDRHAKKYLSFI